MPNQSVSRRALCAALLVPGLIYSLSTSRVGAAGAGICHKGVPKTTKEAVTLSRQWYSTWEYDVDNDRYVCSYFFQPNLNSANIKRQLVIFYDDSPRRHSLYFYNLETEQYWGRCATPYHADHSPSGDKWSLFKNHEWTQFQSLVPFLPGAGDRERPKIASPPNPPGLETVPIVVPPPPQ